MVYRVCGLVRMRISKLLMSCIFITLALAALLASLPLPSAQNSENCSCNDQKKENYVQRVPFSNGLHRLAIIVPFRDRFDELLEFAPHMQTFLSKQNIDFHIFVVNQVDRFRFNRASLINVGFLNVKDNFDYIAMHDVDLLPLNPNLMYRYPDDGPYHVASPDFHPKYNYSTFVGGILLVNRDHFELVNGMSNKYWGWGLEDDEFYVRLKEAKIKVNRPSNITTNRSNTFLHIHDRAHRRRDTVKCYNQYESTRRRDRVTGLDTVSYEIAGEHSLMIDDVPVTVINVKLLCDKNFTPWCECPQPEMKKTTKKSKKS